MSLSVLRQASARMSWQLPRAGACSAGPLAFKIPARPFHARTGSKILAMTGAFAATAARSPMQQTLARAGAKRAYSSGARAEASRAVNPAIRNLLFGGAVFGGTLVAINLVFNGERRDEPSMPAYERQYLNDTFLHTGLGIGIIGLSVYQMVRTGFVFRLMSTSPWVFALGGLGMSFATMIPAQTISPDK